MKSPENSSNKSAYLYAIKLLTKRDYSRFKLERKLVTKGFDTTHVQNAIKEVIERGFLKEEHFATARAKNYMDKGFHPNFIQEKLEEESIPTTLETITELFEEYRVTTARQIEGLIKKKIRSVRFGHSREEDRKKEEKILRYVISKGHCLDETEQVLKKIIQTIQSD